jgi:hypothetical protein
MALKPNYRQQRGDRDRAKARKKQDRLQRRDARRSDADASQSTGDDTEVADSNQSADTPDDKSSG